MTDGVRRSSEDLLAMRVDGAVTSLTAVFPLSGVDVSAAVALLGDQYGVSREVEDGYLWQRSRIFTDSLVPPIRRYLACGPVFPDADWERDWPPRMGSFDLDLQHPDLPDEVRRLTELDFCFPTAPGVVGSGTGDDPDPPAGPVVRTDVRRVSLSWFSAGDSSSAFLAVQLRSRGAGSPDGGSAWLLEDVIRIRHAISHLPGPTGADSARRSPNEEVFALASAVLISCPLPVGQLELADGDARPFALCAVVVPELDPEDAVAMADLLVTGIPVKDVASRIESRSVNDPDDGLMYPSQGVVYFSGYTGAGVVLATTPDTSRFLAVSLPEEVPRILCFLLVLGLHQRLALLSLSRRLGALEILREEGEEEDGLSRSVDEVGGIERDLQRLTAWTTFHEASIRPSQQAFYSLVHGNLGVDLLMSEVRDSVDGAARLLNARLADDQRVDRDRLERLVTGFGLFIALWSVMLGMLSINIDGLTAKEGLPLWALGVGMALVFGSAGVVWWVLSRRRRSGTRPR